MMTNWISTLNAAPRRLSLAGHVDVLGWHYDAALNDNVPHRHTHFEVCLVGNYGRGEYRVGDATHLIRSGDLFIARPGVVHQIVNLRKKRMELYWISFGWAAAQKADATSDLLTLMSDFANSSLVVMPDQNQSVLALWRALESVSQTPRNGWREQVDALTTALVVAIAQAGSDAHRVLDVRPQADNTRALQLALRYVHDNLNRRLSVQEIADHVHLSPRHLSRLMSQFAGISPAAYIEHARLEHAQALILRSQTPFKEIAHLVGYDDVQHFTRVCRRSFGAPPGVVRARGELPESSPHVLNRQKRGALVP